jgi:hypothetical protein
VFTKLLAINDRSIHRPKDSPLERHGPYGKRRVQELFYNCLYSLPRERVYEPLPGNDTHTDTQIDGRDL